MFSGYGHSIYAKMCTSWVHCGEMDINVNLQPETRIYNKSLKQIVLKSNATCIGYIKSSDTGSPEIGYLEFFVHKHRTAVHNIVCTYYDLYIFEFRYNSIFWWRMYVNNTKISERVTARTRPCAVISNTSAHARCWAYVNMSATARSIDRYAYGRRPPDHRRT